LNLDPRLLFVIFTKFKNERKSFVSGMQGFVPRVAVTAVILHENTVLACIGDTLTGFGFDGSVVNVQRFSPHGNVLHGVLRDGHGATTVVFGGRVLTWQRADQKQTIELRNWILSAILFDGGVVVATSRAAAVVLKWEHEGIVQHSLQLASSSVLLLCARVMRISASSFVVVGGTFGGVVRRWKVTGEKVEELDSILLSSTVYSIHTTHDGGRVACGCDDRVLYVDGKAVFGHG
jgi:hypothetical protein